MIPSCVHFTTDIDAPKNLKASEVTMDSATLTWVPPLADIQGYILTYRDEEGNMEVLGFSFSFLIKKLDSYVVNSVLVKA